jgi:hypothetical protein
MKIFIFWKCTHLNTTEKREQQEANRQRLDTAGPSGLEMGDTLGSQLKVPKHEIFYGGFFASKEPIWSPDS